MTKLLLSNPKKAALIEDDIDLVEDDIASLLLSSMQRSLQIIADKLSALKTGARTSDATLIELSSSTQESFGSLFRNRLKTMHLCSKHLKKVEELNEEIENRSLGKFSLCDIDSLCTEVFKFIGELKKDCFLDKVFKVYENASTQDPALVESSKSHSEKEPHFVQHEIRALVADLQRKLDDSDKSSSQHAFLPPDIKELLEKIIQFQENDLQPKALDPALESDELEVESGAVSEWMRNQLLSRYDFLFTLPQLAEGYDGLIFETFSENVKCLYEELKGIVPNYKKKIKIDKFENFEKFMEASFRLIEDLEEKVLESLRDKHIRTLKSQSLWEILSLLRADMDTLSLLSQWDQLRQGHYDLSVAFLRINFLENISIIFPLRDQLVDFLKNLFNHERNCEITTDLLQFFIGFFEALSDKLFAMVRRFC